MFCEVPAAVVAVVEPLEVVAAVDLADEPGAGGVWVALIFFSAGLAVALPGFNIEPNPRCMLQEDKSKADTTSSVTKAKRFIFFFSPDTFSIIDRLSYMREINPI